MEIGDPGSGTSSQFRVLGNDTDSYFDLSNGSNDSIDVKLTKSDGTDNLLIDGHTGNVTHNGDVTIATNKKIKQTGAFMQSSTHQALTLGY